MAQIDLPTGLMPSLKDRLFDSDSMGTPDKPGYTLPQFIESVREDLEDLLNTRRSFATLKREYAELARSVLTYGLPDLGSMDTSTPGKREEIVQVIEKIITTHEPRLRNVKATLIRARNVDLRAQFHIDAELRADPAPKLSFETFVELASGHTIVRETSG